MSTALGHLQERLDEMLDDLRLLVAHESPSGDAERLDALAEVLAARWADLGAEVRRHRVDGVGTHLEIRWTGGAATAEPALLVCHMDTVHAVGTLQRRNPLRVEDGRLYGPGTQDMKAGIVQALHAVRALRDAGRPPARPVVVLITADEEVGSLSSRPLIERLAAESAHAFVLEAAADDGALKTARKGVANYALQVTGEAAHAGIDFHRGVSANVALARLVIALHDLSDPDRGTSVNIGVLHGGTVANVVPESARAEVDVRFFSRDEAERVDRAIRGLAASEGARLDVEGGVNRYALERTAAVERLYSRAREVAAELGVELGEAAVGGASDGNLTAALGVPTLDGLGAVGAGLHTGHEYVDVASLPVRAALLAGLLERV